jgi:hypothetical protein
MHPPVVGATAASAQQTLPNEHGSNVFMRLMAANFLSEQLVLHDADVPAA